MTRAVLVLAALLALGACSAPAAIIQAVAGGASLVVPQQQDQPAP